VSRAGWVMMGVVLFGCFAAPQCAGRQDQAVTAANEGQSEADPVLEPPPQAATPAQPYPPGDTADLSRPLSGCPGQAPDGWGPIQLTPEAASRRWGLGVTSVADVRSSMAVPVEVCGVEGELRWLVSLTCLDGSPPFGSMEHAHGSRAGSMGEGGRCGTIIDRYQVPCPDGVIEVYMDMYHCGPGESFM